ncbi:hypothetical protein PASE110613_00180 [Paenibacillus sediminis]|uniref:Uncharacterized protein n=1 Tax=Paenibacillus sediminis TaxID=664909 RepID=A0ABS4H0G5_9BACL|nr:hypothetical protein [Paenibacillus sediminis]
MFTPIPLSKSEKCGIGYWEGFSPKLRRDITLLGDLEYDHWLFVETNPSISNYCERPTLIKAITNGKVVYFKTHQRNPGVKKKTCLILSYTITKSAPIKYSFRIKNFFLFP